MKNSGKVTGILYRMKDKEKSNYEFLKKALKDFLGSTKHVPKLCLKVYVLLSFQEYNLWIICQKKSETKPVTQSQYGLYLLVCNTTGNLTLASSFFFISIPTSALPLPVPFLPRASLPLMPYRQFHLLAKLCSASNFMQVTCGFGLPRDFTHFQDKVLLYWCGFSM